MGTKRVAIDFSDIEVPSKYSRIDEVVARGNNSLMMLNEVGIKGLKWNIEQKSTDYPQKFEGSCQFTQLFTEKSRTIPAGYTFSAQGTSKANCKHDLADQIMNYLTTQDSTDIKPIVCNKPIMNSNTETSKSLVTSTTIESTEDSVRILNEKVRDIMYKFQLKEDGYTCHASIQGFTFKGSGSSKKIAKRNVAIQALKKLFKYQFTEEKSQKFSVDNDSDKKVMEKIIPSRQKTFSDLLESLIKMGYENMIKNLEMQYTKRKVLAAIVMTRRFECVFPDYCKSNDVHMIDPMTFYFETGWYINPADETEIIRIITITTGTKCISGNKLSSEGNVLNDCHAEIVAKRGLQLFIYETIKKIQVYQNSQQNKLSNNGPSMYALGESLYGCDIVSYANNDKYSYCIKPDVQFHLYISSAPCGDARIFPHSQSDTSLNDLMMNDGKSDAHPNRKNRGLLRTKMERGEGTIPLKETVIQTWDGIIGGERLRTMSCSDKVCLWNVVGVQGALLSNMLVKPIYLSSVIIGSLFKYDHLQRALFERVNGVIETDDWKNKSTGQTAESSVMVPFSHINNQNTLHGTKETSKFFVNKPLMLTVTNQEERNPSKASNYSFNWIVTENSVEIVHTGTGLTINNTPSRLCKRSLFKKFLLVFDWPKIPMNSTDQSGASVYYDECKYMKSVPPNTINSIEYHNKKISLFKYLDNNEMNLGRWLSKPLELDQFFVSFNSTGSMINNLSSDEPIDIDHSPNPIKINNPIDSTKHDVIVLDDDDDE